MAAILADYIFNSILSNENDNITLIQISLKYVSRSRIDNTPVLVKDQKFISE